jgi:hypothetical protein
VGISTGIRMNSNPKLCLRNARKPAGSKEGLQGDPLIEKPDSRFQTQPSNGALRSNIMFVEIHLSALFPGGPS